MNYFVNNIVIPNHNIYGTQYQHSEFKPEHKMISCKGHI